MLAPGPDGPVRGITLLVDTGVADQVLPEIPRLRLEVDEHLRHKDVYQHSLTVLEQAIALEARLRAGVRSGGPAGRAAARHRQAEDPAAAAGWPGGVPPPRGGRARRWSAPGWASCASRRRSSHDVAALVALHLRFHGYGDGEWTDSAVRRYVRDAGPLLSRLHVLTRADCTTRNKREGATAGARLRRPGEADRRRSLSRRNWPRSGRTSTATRSWQCSASRGPGGRQGVPAPAGAADGARPARPRAGHSGTAALGGGRRALAAR